jgi:DNA transformation protein and related proteins
MNDDRPIPELRNIDSAITQWLHEVGIDSAGQLRKIGAATAYRTMRAWRPWSAELIVLWALEGAINDVDWIDVTPERRLELRREVDPDVAPRPDAQEYGPSRG